MNFLFKCFSNFDISNIQVLKENKYYPDNNNFLLFDEYDDSKILKYENANKIVYIIGDLIIKNNVNISNYLYELFLDFEPTKLKDLQGIFYLIILDKNKHKISFYNSIFSLLPIYYQKSKDYFYVSSSLELIKKLSFSKLTLNSNFIIDKVLLNYSFENETIYNEINLIPSNSFLAITKDIEIKKYADISDLYVATPKKWKESIDDISDFVITKFKDYFPEEPVYLTLTGGFDGRTIGSISMYNDLMFVSFSYGSNYDSDILIPQFLSKNIGFEHISYLLDDVYSTSLFMDNAFELISLTSANASISRSHYVYVAKELSKRTKYFMSGNFGSEIIRTMRVPGVMTSDIILKLFFISDNKTFENYVLNHPLLKYFNSDFLNININNFIERLLKYKHNLPSGLNSNQMFYIYLFEEVFRKYFGPEFVIQFQSGLFNRAPFLDYGFITEILKTELAGVNGRYLENNPIYRYKGQILYSNIMRKLNSSFYYYNVDRGYKPSDFFSPLGKFNISFNYLKRKLLNSSSKDYTHYNHLSFKNNFPEIRSITIDNNMFDDNSINNSKFSDTLSHIYSLLLYISKFD